MTILFGLLVGAVLWLVLKIIRHGALAAAPRFSALGRAAPLIPAITFLVWLVYGFWIVHSLFSRLSGEVVSERAEEKSSDHFRVRVSVDKPGNPDAIRADLVRRVLCNPWASFRVMPVVHPAGEDETSFSFEVRFQSLSPRQAARVESALRK